MQWSQSSVTSYYWPENLAFVNSNPNTCIFSLNYNQVHDNCGFACGVSETRKDHVAQDYAEQGLSPEVSRRIPHTVAAHSAGPAHTPPHKAVSHSLQMQRFPEKALQALLLSALPQGHDNYP